MSFSLGIDVGGTASRWVAVDSDGTIVARGKGPSATGHLFADLEHRRFEAMIAAVRAAFPGPVQSMHLGVTGYGPRAEASLKAICAAAFGVAPEHVVATDDMGLAFASVFEPGRGHLVSGGTGSIGVHVAADGTEIRVGGRGILVDDGGSGSWIALTAIDRIFRLIDETGTTEGAGKLAGSLFEAIGGATWDDVRAYVYGNDRGRIGALAPAVAHAAQQGDPMARAILEQAGTELARLGKALCRRAGRLPIAFIGGVLDLDPIIKLTLTAALPDTEVDFPKPDAALCAARLAHHSLYP